MPTTDFQKGTTITKEWLNEADDHIFDQTVSKHSASHITNTPSGNLASTTVQDALNELQGDVDTLQSKASSGDITSSGLTTTTNTVLGRTTAGTGAIENLAIASQSDIETGTSSVIIPNVLTVKQGVLYHAPVNVGCRKLKIVSNASTTITITADSAVLYSASTQRYIRFNNISTSITSTSVGLRGIDTGTISSNTLYSIYLISDGNSISCIASLSETAPATVSGYSYSCRIGSVYYALGGVTNWLPQIQLDDSVFFHIGNVVITPTTLLVSGVAGTYSTTLPTLVAVTLSNRVPGTAKSVILEAATTYNGGATSTVLVEQYQSTGAGPASSGGHKCCIGAANTCVIFEMPILDTLNTSVYWCSSASGAALFLHGYKDRV